MSSATPSKGKVEVDTRELFRLYAAGEHATLTDMFRTVFDHFNQTTYLEMQGGVSANIVNFLKNFLAILTQPDYIIPEEHAIYFVSLNELISHLVAMTPFRTTDGFLECLRMQPSNLAKILTLYSARNRLRFDPRAFFDVHPQLASIWYGKFCLLYRSGIVEEEARQHLAEHLRCHDERMMLTADINAPYFGSTYVDGDLDRHVKPFLNTVVRRSTRVRCTNRPNPKKIGIFSDVWRTQHSVYRNYYAYVKALKEKFHLTFYHSMPPDGFDFSLFDEVVKLEFRDGSLDIKPLQTNDFSVFYFPDIGMTLPSIMLANYRIAPIQICSPGHSVSTWGADIDYYVSGADVEIPNSPERNYSERLLLLPGMGVIHNKPNYELTGRKKDGSEIIINFPTSSHKLNAGFLKTLRKLLEQIRRPVRFRIFPATLGMQNSYLPFLTAVRKALSGTSVVLDIKLGLPYGEYMGCMEEGDLILDAYHFGGCNVVSDSLFVGKPIVLWQGDKWYNRIGPAMLRMVGVEELVANNEDEYLRIALRLIHDDQWRDELTFRIQAADLDKTVYSVADAPSFRRAVEFLIANHDRLKSDVSREPIRIL